MTQASMAHIELIPGFPIEIAHQIIYGLSFLDLFRFQAVSRTWKDFIESDRTTSEIMFLFPREIHEAPTLLPEHIISKSYGKSLTVDNTTARATCGTV
jgi:hypothetical protein